MFTEELSWSGDIDWKILRNTQEHKNGENSIIRFQALITRYDNFQDFAKFASSFYFWNFICWNIFSVIFNIYYMSFKMTLLSCLLPIAHLIQEGRIKVSLLIEWTFLCTSNTKLTINVHSLKSLFLEWVYLNKYSKTIAWFSKIIIILSL